MGPTLTSRYNCRNVKSAILHIELNTNSLRGVSLFCKKNPGGDYEHIGTVQGNLHQLVTIHCKTIILIAEIVLITTNQSP